MKASAASDAQGWLSRPPGPATTLGLALLVIASSAWLFADSLGAFPLLGRAGQRIVSVVWLGPEPVAQFRLKGDDFHYLAESRDSRALRANLWKPHNAHVVPLFRAGTFGLVRFSGGLAHVRRMLAHASFAALALVLLTCGHFVTRETGSSAAGLMAMLFAGVTSVMQPVVVWYSASQTLWAGQLILVMLVFLQSWRHRGGWWRLACGLLAAFLAPATWGGGLAAGPVGTAYLWADRRHNVRRAALLPVGAAALAFITLTVLSRMLSPAPSALPDMTGSNAVRGVAHTGQAIVEALCLNNLGVDGTTTPVQAATLCAALLLVWGWSRRSFRPSPMEAAGAALVGSCYLMAYTFRGGFSYASLRDLRWYHAIPQVGAVLFALGWWSEVRAKAGKGLACSTSRTVLVFAGALAALLVVHGPRVQALLSKSVYPMSEDERRELPIPSLQRLRGIILAEDLAKRQDRFLARLDRLQRTASRLGTDRDSIRQVFGRLVVPGWPDSVTDIDALDLLAFPNDGRQEPTRAPRAANRLSADQRAATYAAFRSTYFAEPENRPPWVSEGQPWPPKR